MALLSNFQGTLDAATVSLLILFFMNLFVLLLIGVSFGIIRRFRGDKVKERS